MKKRAIAEKLLRLYYANIFAKSEERGYTTNRRHQKTLADLSDTERRHFILTAKQVKLVGADPREYIIAQFQAFKEYSQVFGKFVYPMPHQLASIAALARYERYKGQQELRSARKAPVVTSTSSGFFSEERRLAGLVRAMRSTPDDVLTTMPEEFTRAFLQHMKVWPVVEQLWNERAN